MLTGLGLGAAVTASAWAKEFWNEKKPEDWTEDEIRQILSKSPWAKVASIFDVAAHRTVSSAPIAGGLDCGAGPLPPMIGGVPMPTMAGGNPSPTMPGNPLPTVGSSGKWQATVRWESALPVRNALKAKISGVDENYIIALVGDIPGAGVPTDDDSLAERAQKMDVLKESTRIERKGDPLELQEVRISPRRPRSPSGTLFYFSRVFPITPEDKQVTFVTKIGPLEVKCKFTLHDMMYRGKLEL